MKPFFALLAVALVLGCTGAPAATEAAPQDAVPEEISRLPIGLQLGVGTPADTAVLAVTVKSAELVGEYESDEGKVTAPAGKKFILADVEIRQKGSSEIPAGRDMLFATDSERVAKYPAGYSGTDGLVGLVQLSGGKSIVGKAAFLVPEDIGGAMVVYEFGPAITVTNMVAWIV